LENILVDAARAVWIKDFFGGISSIRFVSSEALYAEGMTSPKIVWIAFLHLNPIEITTSTLTFVYTRSRRTETLFLCFFYVPSK
jgi:hypothetical protein